MFILIWKIISTVVILFWIGFSSIRGIELYIATGVMLTMLLIRELVIHYCKPIRKPMISTIGKVQSKVEWVPDKGPISYRANILLPKKKAIMLELSKNQYDAIIENITVDLIYQGNICASIKAAVNQSPIINTIHYPSGGKKFAKLMEFEANKAKS